MKGNRRSSHRLIILLNYLSMLLILFRFGTTWRRPKGIDLIGNVTLTSFLTWSGELLRQGLKLLRKFPTNCTAEVTAPKEA